jgi:hypothetical protein
MCQQQGLKAKGKNIDKVARQEADVHRPEEVGQSSVYLNSTFACHTFSMD